MCDAGVQSGWQENTALGVRETACESHNRSSCLPSILPSLLHAGVTGVMAERDAAT